RAGCGSTAVLHGVSLSVLEGQVVSLLGANGAGKTTTLRAITGGVRWTGDIRFGGRSLRRMGTEDVVRRGIAHVPEGRGICTELTVDENLKLGSHLRRDKAEVAKDYNRVFEYFPVLRGRPRRATGQRVVAPPVPGLLMQEFLQLAVSGIATGAIFASLALALVLIYNAMGLVNFAQGEMAMFATFIAYTLVNRGMSFWIAFPVTMVLAFGAGIVIQRVVIKPVERAPVLT